jgi:hypothetical protein
MAFIQQLGSLRSPVNTYTNLPITGNVIGDLRIITDLGVLYTWTSSSGSGSLSDWKKVTVSSYNDLKNRPGSTALAIDDATLAIRNIFMNYIIILFRRIISLSAKVYKMYDGMFDNFTSASTIDSVHSTNFKYLPEHTYVGNRDFPKQRYAPNFGGFDEYTQVLIQGGQPYVEGLDLCGNVIWGQLTDVDTVITKFHANCWKFNGGGNEYLEISNFNPPGKESELYFLDKVEGLDFTWDLWIRFEYIDGKRTIINQRTYADYDVCNFLVEKTEDNVVRVYYKGSTDIEIDVSGTTELIADTWYHLAIIRESGYFKIYINGQLDATSVNSDNHAIKELVDRTAAPVAFAIGGFYYAPQNLFQGWMDEIRCSIGIARWTSNFSVPTVAYQTGTQIPPCDNMSLQSEGYEANSIPTSARLIIVMEDNGSVIPNTDLKAYVSRDGGTTFTRADLAREFEVEPTYYLPFLTRFYVGTFDLSTQPNGKEVVYKITSHNNKDFRIRYIALNWK